MKDVKGSDNKTVAKLKLYSTAAEISKAIVSIKSRGVKLQSDIHRASVSCLAHIEKHNDITLFTSLVDAMPTMSRKNALITWGVAFGKLRLVEQEKGSPILRFNKQGTTLLAAAEAKPFYDFVPEPELKPFNFAEALERVLKQVDTHAKKPVDGDFMPTADQLKLVRDLHKLIAPVNA